MDPIVVESVEASELSELLLMFWLLVEGREVGRLLGEDEGEPKLLESI